MEDEVEVGGTSSCSLLAPVRMAADRVRPSYNMHMYNRALRRRSEWNSLW